MPKRPGMQLVGQVQLILPLPEEKYIARGGGATGRRGAHQERAGGYFVALTHDPPRPIPVGLMACAGGGGVPAFATV